MYMYIYIHIYICMYMYACQGELHLVNTREISAFASRYRRHHFPLGHISFMCHIKF